MINTFLNNKIIKLKSVDAIIKHPLVFIPLEEKIREKSVELYFNLGDNSPTPSEDIGGDYFSVAVSTNLDSNWYGRIPLSSLSKPLGLSTQLVGAIVY